jgi:hypothetical protein
MEPEGSLPHSKVPAHRPFIIIIIAIIIKRYYFREQGI